jgi:hypothetical protein
MQLKQDLLEDWVIIMTNGRIQSRLGQVRTLAFPSFLDAFHHFCDMINIRIKRDYLLKQYQSDNPVLLQLLPYVASSNADISSILPTSVLELSPKKITRKKATPMTPDSYQQLGFGF